MSRPDDKRKAAALQVARAFLEDNRLWLDGPTVYDMYLDACVDAICEAPRTEIADLLTKARAGERYAYDALRRAAVTYHRRKETLPELLNDFVIAELQDEAPRLRPGRAKFEASKRDRTNAQAVAVVHERGFSERQSASIVKGARGHEVGSDQRQRRARHRPARLTKHSPKGDHQTVG